MPAIVTLDQERGIRITSAVGPVRWSDFLEIYRMIAADPKLSTVKRTLVDLRYAELVGVTRADVHAAVHLPKLPREEGTRLAIVTESKVVYGISRMYAMMQVIRETGDVEVFTSLDEAMTWIAD